MSLPVVGFAGLTHLGLNSLVASAMRGFEVVGYDNSQEVVANLKLGKPAILEPRLEESIQEFKSKMIFSTLLGDLSQCDIVYISVDVPTDDTGTSDLSHINKIVKEVTPHLKYMALLVVLCQVPPGYTRKINWPEQQLFYQVETLIFGRALDRALNPERFIIGCSNPSRALPKYYSTYLSAFNCPVLPMRYESAELAKISINMFLISSVSTSNMLAEVCEKIGASWAEIVPALRLDKRIGQHAYLSPGLGISGGNLERDMATIVSLSKENKTDSNIVKAWQDNSNYRKNWVYQILKEKVPTYSKQKIGLLGLTYKENTNSIKNSPAICFLDKLIDCQVKAFDPAAPEINRPNFERVKTISEVLNGADILAIMTPWDEFRAIDLSIITSKMNGKIILDPYGVLRQLELEKLGFRYFCLGDHVL